MIIHGDAIEELGKMSPGLIDCCFTSPNPPFHTKEIDNAIVGGEQSTGDYIRHLVVIFDFVKRVLKDTGSLWVQMGDYHDSNTLGLMLIPEQFAITMRQAGWILRDNTIWHRTEKIHKDAYNKTRCRRDVEYLFRFVKPGNIDKGFFNINGNSYWMSSVRSYPYNFKPGIFNSGLPSELIDCAIKLTCPRNGIILDPMAGTGLVGEIAKRENRAYILIDISEFMVNGMKKRLGVAVAK